MVERIISPRLADIIEAIERIGRVLDGIPLDSFEQDWEKRWLVERGIEIISEASRHLSDDMKTRQAGIPWAKVAGIGNVLRHDYDQVAPDVLWKLARDDLPLLCQVCREELAVALAREEDDRDANRVSGNMEPAGGPFAMRPLCGMARLPIP
jgi:uncharacterized protein with HEPN domain